MRARARLAVGVGALSALAAAGTVAVAGRGGNDIRERLTGYEEVPALSTSGTGNVRVSVRGGGSRVHYRLRYSRLEGSVQQAHIHLGQRGVNGGVVAFLCSNIGGGPPGTPACPASPGRVSGTLRAADVIGPAAQGIDPGELDELVRALRAGATYANVHSDKYPAGEVRAQLERGKKGRR